MSSAEAQASTGAGLADAVAGLRSSPRVALIIGVAVAVAILAALLLWTRSPDYAVLYSGLANRDGGDVVAQLEQMQVPYRLAAGGSTIEVPRSEVDRVRLQLASDGLPKGGGVGFEIMNQQPFGVSEFAEKVNYRRALAGELERSIETIDEVAEARIALAIPKSTIFVRKRKQPKASVVVNLYQGRALADGQVAAIQHLVASAVPGLPVDAVTVVDGRGHLLSSSTGAPGGTDGSRLTYAARVEKSYQKRIQNLLAPIVGADNVHAQIVADVDFSSRERTSDQYTPNNQNGPAAVRSRQSQQTVNKNADHGGVPGALSNQPSPDRPSPINNAPAADKSGSKKNGQRRQSAAGNGSLKTDGALGLADSGRISTSQSATTNYELNHVVQHVTDPVGRVSRISAAVLINQNAAIGPAQAPDQTRPGSGAKMSQAGLSDARMKQIRGLVRGAIGYSADRGDTVEVMQMPFSRHPSASGAAAPPWWQNAPLQALAIRMVKYLILALVAWLLWRRLVGPLIERSGLLDNRADRASAAPVSALSAEPTAEDAEREQRAHSRRRYQDLVETTQKTARDDPRVAAMIIKSWMKADA